MSDDPSTAGLPIDNRLSSPSSVAAYSLAKAGSSPNSLVLCVVGDTDADVLGIFTNSRGPGSTAGVGFCGARGLLLPMLSDGEAALSSGERVTVSADVDGRCTFAASGGFGTVISGAPAVVDAVVLVLFEGAMLGGGGVTLPLTTSLPFTAAANREVYVEHAVTGDGMKITVRAANAEAGAHQGGDARLFGGNASSVDGVPGAAIVNAGSTLDDSGPGGSASMAGGYGTTGGECSIQGGPSIAGPAGTAYAYGGDGLEAACDGGEVDVRGGGATVSGTGGAAGIRGGDSTLGAGGDVTVDGGVGSTTTGSVHIASATAKLGFYAKAPVALQTGVAVDAAGIHAALVNLGLITA